jgi:hypothetical protein
MAGERIMVAGTLNYSALDEAVNEANVQDVVIVSYRRKQRRQRRKLSDGRFL